MNRNKKAVGWGFLSGGFAGAGTMLLGYSALQALAVSCFHASAWCAMLAMLEWAPTGTTRE